ncbi:hypothetical protein Tco_0750596 [Tanacetum coccineum]|uniref:Uncharacterized protein n=1 Tax=Tanacetum coccineum TaxID=301880 RepID=A0ABQ4Z4K2_9ASTR
MKGECEVLKEKEKARDKECEEIKAKCEAAMEEFNKNPIVMVLCQNIMSLLAEVKEHKESMERMLLESQKWAGYQEYLTTLESKVGVLEVEKGRLEAAEALLRQELKAVKYDRAKVVSKVVPYVAIDLLQSDEMAMLVGKFVSSTIFYGRCAAFEEVADIKEPLDLAKVKGYMPSYKKEHTKGSNDLSTATFPILIRSHSRPFYVSQSSPFQEAKVSSSSYYNEDPCSCSISSLLESHSVSLKIFSRTRKLGYKSWKHDLI